MTCKTHRDLLAYAGRHPGDRHHQSELVQFAQAWRQEVEMLERRIEALRKRLENKHD